MNLTKLRYFFCVMVLVFLSPANAVSQSSWIQYMSGEDTVRAYLAMPEGEGPFPALMVIHEWWGLNGWIQENADELAREGYASLAIDLYRGRVASSSDEAHELMRGVPEDRAAKDLRSAFAYLASRTDVSKDKIGSIGWCMGGGYSLAAALNIEGLGASVVCYGRLVTDEEEIRKISCPVLGIFGSADRGIPEASVRVFERSAQKLDKNVRVAIYPNVGHAFMNSNNKNAYDADSTEDAWKRIHSFLMAKLKKGD